VYAGDADDPGQQDQDVGRVVNEKGDCRAGAAFVSEYKKAPSPCPKPGSLTIDRIKDQARYRDP